MKEELVTSRRNPTVQHVRKLLSSKSYRLSCGAYAAEGTKLLDEALRWGAEVQLVLLQEELACPQLPQGVSCVRVPRDVMQSVSQQQSPQGAAFVCKLPPQRPARLLPGTLLLDGVQDPGNLGTMLRTADALEIPVVLLDGCAEAYSPKTVRASMGAVFRTPPVCLRAEQALALCREAGLRVWAAALEEGAADLRACPVADGAVIIGSEGQGVRRALLDACDGTVVIPMNPRCESLNAAVAAAIVMWQIRAGRA